MPRDTNQIGRDRDERTISLTPDEEDHITDVGERGDGTYGRRGAAPAQSRKRKTTTRRRCGGGSKAKANYQRQTGGSNDGRGRGSRRGMAVSTGGFAVTPSNGAATRGHTRTLSTTAGEAPALDNRGLSTQVPGHNASNGLQQAEQAEHQTPMDRNGFTSSASTRRRSSTAAQNFSHGYQHVQGNGLQTQQTQAESIYPSPPLSTCKVSKELSFSGNQSMINPANPVRERKPPPKFTTGK